MVPFYRLVYLNTRIISCNSKYTMCHTLSPMRPLLQDSLLKMLKSPQLKPPNNITAKHPQQGTCRPDLRMNLDRSRYRECAVVHEVVQTNGVHTQYSVLLCTPCLLGVEVSKRAT